VDNVQYYAVVLVLFISWIFLAKYWRYLQCQDQYCGARV